MTEKGEGKGKEQKREKKRKGIVLQAHDNPPA